MKKLIIFMLFGLEMLTLFTGSQVESALYLCSMTIVLAMQDSDEKRKQ